MDEEKKEITNETEISSDESYNEEVNNENDEELCTELIDDDNINENMSKDLYVTPDDVQISDEEMKDIRKKASKNVILLNTPDDQLDKRKLRKKHNLKKFLSYGNGYDIKYKGLLGIRGLKITAWVFMCFTAIGISYTFYRSVVAPDSSVTFASVLVSIVTLFGQLAVPCFMLAKFSTIIKNRKGYLATLITYFLLAVLIIVGFMFFYFRYAVGFVRMMTGETIAEASVTLNTVFGFILKKKMAFNIFVDMFLWALFFTFFDYTPKKLVNNKVGKILFRSLAIIPFLLVCVGFVYKFLYATNNIYVPPYFCVILPTSTPLTFMVFMLISVFIRDNKKYYLSLGGTEEQYKNYVKSNANSFHYAKMAAIAFAIIGIFDIFVESIIYGMFENYQQVIAVSGIGESGAYIIFAPTILLFSITRKYEPNRADIIIPLVGIGIFIFVIFEGIFRVLISL